MRDTKALATRDTPFGLLRQMTSELDRMFDDPWNFKWPALLADTTTTAWLPRVDVLEQDHRLITRVDLPGVKKEDVSVEVRDGELVLSGERKTEKKTQDQNLYRSECQYGSFYRAVPLPDGATADDVKATFANGVLEVSVPLPAVKPNGRKIAIKDAA